MLIRSIRASSAYSVSMIILMIHNVIVCEALYIGVGLKNYTGQ